MAIYTVVDGVFITHFISEDALSAGNIVTLVLGIVTSIALMLAVGANAAVARQLGECNEHEVKSTFVLIYIFRSVIGVIERKKHLESKNHLK